MKVATIYLSSKKQRFIAWFLLVITGLGLLTFLSSPTFAQTETDFSYWQYDALGRIDLLELGDVNADGIDEFVVVAEDVNIALLRSNGLPIWESVQTEEKVLQIALGNINGAADPAQEIVLGTRDALIVLDREGKVVWENQLAMPPVTGEALNSLGDSEWRRSAANPLAIKVFDYDGDGFSEILTALRAGQIRLFDGLTGEVIWEYVGKEPPAFNAFPEIEIADLDRDGRPEIAFTYFTQRDFTELVVLNANGQRLWRHSLSGRATAVEAVEFEATAPVHLGVGTTRGVVRLYNGASGDERWVRTPNVAVTSMTAALLADEPALVIGTAVGTMVAYDEQGQRLWDHAFAERADRAVVNVSAAPEQDDAFLSGQPLRLIATLAPAFTTRSEPADVLLLDSSGRILERYNPASILGLSRLTDINHDNKSELLLASFGTLVLSDPGLSSDAQRFVVGGMFRLDARPRVVQTVDLDRDGRDELLVGADDGRLHLLQPDGVTSLWQLKFEGSIGQLAVADREEDGEPLIIVTHNSNVVEEETGRTQGWLEILRPDGRQPAWATSLLFEETITSLLVEDINGVGRPEILIGTASGQIYAYSLALDLLWEAAVDGSVVDLSLMLGERNRPEIVAVTEADKLYLLNNKGREENHVEYAVMIQNILKADTDDPLAQLIVVTQDGQVRGLSAGGVTLEEWRTLLGDAPLLALEAHNSILIATNESRLVRLSTDVRTPLETVWELNDLGTIRNVYWGDLNGDVRPDAAVGNEAGSILLYDSDGRRWGETSLGSGIFQLAALNDGQGVNLIAVTENGVVHRLSAQANRPPLLVNPQTEVNVDLYSISVNVLDVDRDAVAVNLLLYDSGQGEWIPQGERVASRGDDILFWPALPLEGNEPVRYRFDYDDGTYIGQVEPALGPQPNPSVAWGELILLLGALSMMIGGGLLVRQIQLFGWRTARFYKQIKNRPRETLILLDVEYNRQKGLPDFLINLSNLARRDQNQLITSLTDGLYLLADRPETGLAILISVLEEAQRKGKDWWALDVWVAIYKTTLTLLEAPTTIELGLLRPRLVQLVDLIDKAGMPSIAFESLLAPLNSLRDSNRVTHAEDRVVYLHEALVMLRQQQALSIDRPTTIQNTLIIILISRWMGLINAAIDDLRGRAWLGATLKTKRLVPAGDAVIALEIENSGRAAAENVRVLLQEDPAAFAILQTPDPIPLLAAGRSRTVNFTISPHSLDSFRLVFETDYDDMTHRKHAFEFADMVHMLPPVREFKSIMNPYAPGTPLRRKSPLFYGREGLLRFIISNVERGVRTEQPSVLILVGERRTGKTSALLRLEDYAPAPLLPVYVDCQSFGVIEGMGALLHDLAWFIADALAVRDYELEVPEIHHWHEDPGHYFQRVFLPQVYALLPENTTLILVFDEFEAFENLVNDGILPPTFFTFLRHLMQHGQGLSFVFAGTHRLEEMTSDYWSVLFNIALYQQVGYLEEAAARELICKPVAPNIIYDDLALDKIWRVTAGHPYFLQLVCYTLVNQANHQETGYITISDVNAALKDMLRLGEVHFAYLWQQSSYEERVLLTAVAHLYDHEGPFQPTELINSLEPYDIYLAPPTAIMALNNLVERGIMREIVEEGTLWYQLRIGLVGLWTAQNKSFAQLYRDNRRQKVKV